MAGQRTKLILGDVKADVSLVKTSGESAGPRWQSVEIDTATGRPVVESTAEAMPDQVLLGGSSDDVDHGEAAHEAYVQTVGSGSPIVTTGEARDRTAIEHPLTRSGITPIIPQTVEQSLARDAMAGHAPPPVRYARGIYAESGEFVDLTQLLEDIDEHVKLEGLTVAKSIDSTAIPRGRVRGSFWVEPAGDKAGVALSTRVRDLLWTVLAEDRRALVVRWTKRTNQALGIIRASKANDALELLEIEWGPNMRKPSKRAQVTPGFEASEAELEAARDFLKRTAAPASELDTLADERRVLQVQALELAKTGEVLELPERHSDDEALAAALGAS